nr:hypothetical protein [Candidatus Enterovibrio escacola]
MPSLIHPSYRFVTTYAFSDIRFLKYLKARKRNDGLVLRLQITPHDQ